jgi:hypothetical protein
LLETKRSCCRAKHEVGHGQLILGMSVTQPDSERPLASRGDGSQDCAAIYSSPESAWLSERWLNNARKPNVRTRTPRGRVHRRETASIVRKRRPRVLFAPNTELIDSILSIINCHDRC